MAQFEPSQHPESFDRDAREPENNVRSSGPNPPDREPQADNEEPSEPSAQPPADWMAAPREVLQGLTEEATNESDSDSLENEPIAHDERARTAQRSSRRRQPSLTRQRPTRPVFTLEQRLLILDAWRRSGLPGSEFAPLVGVAPHTLYCWRRGFQDEGPAGLVEKPRGAPPGSRLPEVTKRAILLMKQDHPEWGCQRISDVLMRGPALGASAAAVARVLHEAGYELEEVPTHPHPPEVHRFERARPNQLWQTDLFTFMLKRQNRRVYLVAFLDDHSRFIVSYGLHASQSAALVIEVLRAGIASYGVPQEILTDNGSQYVTWRGKSAFTRELEKRGIRQVVSARKHPQTLGKIERFWGTLWRECIEEAIFLDLGDARRRIGLFLDHYNFQRTNLGIDGLVPADRFFGAASEVLRTLRARVAANARDLARHGVPRKPFYLTGQVGGKPFSVHAAGERVIWTDAAGTQREIDLVPPLELKQPKATADQQPLNPLTPPVTTPPALHLPESICPDGSPREGMPPVDDADPTQPGTSPLDDSLARLTQGLADPPTTGNHTEPSSEPSARSSEPATQGGGQ